MPLISGSFVWLFDRAKQVLLPPLHAGEQPFTLRFDSVRRGSEAEGGHAILRRGNRELTVVFGSRAADWERFQAHFAASGVSAMLIDVDGAEGELRDRILSTAPREWLANKQATAIVRSTAAIERRARQAACAEWDKRQNDRVDDAAAGLEGEAALRAAAVACLGEAGADAWLQARLLMLDDGTPLQVVTRPGGLARCLALLKTAPLPARRGGSPQAA